MISELQSTVAALRGKKQWDKIYALLQPVLDRAVGAERGDALVQWAATRYAECAETACEDIKLTDEAITLLAGHADGTALALMMGITYALYANDITHGEAYVKLADQLIATGDPGGVEWHGRLLMMCAYYYYEVARYRRAVEYLTRGLEFYEAAVGPYGPEDRECQLQRLHTAMGESLLALGMRGKAVKHLNLALACDTKANEASIFYLRAMIAAYSGQIELAKRLFRESLAAVQTANHRFRLKVAEAFGKFLREQQAWDELSDLVRPFRQEAKQGRLVQNLLRLQRLATKPDGGEVTACSNV